MKPTPRKKTPCREILVETLTNDHDGEKAQDKTEGVDPTVEDAERTPTA